MSGGAYEIDPVDSSEFGGMTEVIPRLRQVESALESVVASFRMSASSLDDQPVNDNVKQFLRDAAAGIEHEAADVGQMESTFRAEQAEDLEKHEHPRPNEEGWDVS